ncbi:unknown [Clostridium sp. CAG:524]|nr:unknown [Clostridium sp. CAG:524]
MKNKIKERILKFTIVITLILAINMLIFPIITSIFDIDIADDLFAKYRFFPLLISGFFLIIEILLFSSSNKQFEIKKYVFHKNDLIKDILLFFDKNNYNKINKKSDFFDKIYLKNEKNNIELFSIIKSNIVLNEKMLFDLQQEYKKLIENEYSISRVKSICIVNIFLTSKVNTKLKKLIKKSIIQNVGFLNLLILVDESTNEIYIPNISNNFFNVSYKMYKKELKVLKEMLLF